MRFEISQSLNGDQIVYIARDAGGTVRIRENSLEAIQQAIKSYQPPSKVDLEKETKAKEAQDAQLQATLAQEAVDSQPEETPESPEPGKKLLRNSLQDTIEASKDANKKSFWDKLR